MSREREVLIDSLIAWKLRSPSAVTLFIGGREVVVERELGERHKKPDLPRVYGTLFDYKDRRMRHSFMEKLEGFDAK